MANASLQRQAASARAILQGGLQGHQRGQGHGQVVVGQPELPDEAVAAQERQRRQPARAGAQQAPPHVLDVQDQRQREREVQELGRGLAAQGHRPV
ncbi:MAG: hypothetical protein H6740_02630 [Alphaproteobacteria bacterium]|nr:hypothetical protein [Alphaproteobacteria bacterium]